MTEKLGEIILEELFKLSGKIDKMQDEINGIKSVMATKDDLKAFATKEDIKNMATKDDLKAFATKEDIKNMATKDDLKAFATKNDLKEMELRLETKMNQKFHQQVKDFSEMFHDSYVLNSKYRREMEERITKATDKKIMDLRKEFLCKKA